MAEKPLDIQVVERLINKAVLIWTKWVFNPTSNAGLDDGIGAALFGLFVAKNTERNNTDSNIATFAERLKAALMKKIDGRPGYYASLDTDYGPERLLADVSEGMSLQFPVKTNMNIYSNRIFYSYGYQGRGVILYPLSNNRWLETDLSGDRDLEKIIEFVETGKIPEFNVIQD